MVDDRRGHDARAAGEGFVFDPALIGADGERAIGADGGEVGVGALGGEVRVVAEGGPETPHLGSRQVGAEHDGVGNSRV
ncbi:MAG: hypothetical protein RLZZ244_690 [Verrucomicrobiota bacterium]